MLILFVNFTNIPSCNFRINMFLYRKSPSKTNDKSALVKQSGPPRAQAKFDYTGKTDDDLTFKVSQYS